MLAGRTGSDTTSSIPLDTYDQQPRASTSSSPPRSRTNSSRPDHSAVVLPSSDEPPDQHPLLANGRTPEFTEKYGGYGSDELNGNEDISLDGAMSGSSAYHRARSRSSPYAILLLSFVLLGLVLFLLIRYSVVPTSSTALISPYLPASFFFLISPAGAGRPPAHPILPLIRTANNRWTALVSSQSKTYSGAVRTYKSRYGLQPPPGFDRWFAFATQGRNHSLVDEYDGLMADLLPYRSLTPPELRRRIAELAEVPGVSIVSIRKGVAQVHSKSGRWAPALAFQQMLAAFVKDLPDMDVAINEKPEGRVLPRRQRNVILEEYGLEEGEDLSNMTDPMVKPSLKGFLAEWKRDGTVWDAFRRACPPESPSRRLVESVRSAEASAESATLLVQSVEGPRSRRRVSGVAIPPVRELTFSSDIDGTYDICAVPSIHTLHSAFYSDQRSIEYLYPVFSPSKPSGFADILIPSHHYWAPSSEFTYEWELKRGRTQEPSDVDWDAKDDKFYWRGKVIRGADTPPGHASSFQKQRLVKLTNDVSAGVDKVIVAFNGSTKSLVSTSVPVVDLSKATADIAMACDPKLGECAYIRSLGYRVEPPAPLSDAWKHKYVLDLDEIGFSPRFLALMESKSAVIKSSVQKEFWKHWIQPWKHYIPLSSSYSELYNIQTFFTGFPEDVVASKKGLRTTVLTHPNTGLLTDLPPNADGSLFNSDTALQDIAQAGTEWKHMYLRKADMECYVYRLMIEWAAMTTAS